MLVCNRPVIRLWSPRVLGVNWDEFTDLEARLTVSREDRLKGDLRRSLIAQPSSKFACLVRLLPEIECSIANGHGYQECIELLKRNGLEFSLPSFKGTLVRARRLSVEDRNRICGVVQSEVRNDLPTAVGSNAISRAVLPPSAEDQRKDSGSQESKNVSESSSGSTIVSKGSTSVPVIGGKKTSVDTNPVPELKALW